MLVAAAFAERPAIALAIARDILLPQHGGKRFTMRGISSFAHVAKYTAIQTLRRIGSPPALNLLSEYLRAETIDPTLKRLAQTIVSKHRAWGSRSGGRNALRGQPRRSLCCAGSACSSGRDRSAAAGAGASPRLRADGKFGGFGVSLLAL